MRIVPLQFPGLASPWYGESGFPYQGFKDLSDPGSKRQSTDLGVGGGKLGPENTLHNWRGHVVVKEF